VSLHLHPEFVPGCYRCDLSADEARIPEHDCDAGLFDRVLCGCGAMHSYCTVCVELQDECELEAAL